jgi:hypothetical protein
VQMVAGEGAATKELGMHNSRTYLERYKLEKHRSQVDSQIFFRGRRDKSCKSQN